MTGNGQPLSYRKTTDSSGVLKPGDLVRLPVTPVGHKLWADSQLRVDEKQVLPQATPEQIEAKSLACCVEQQNSGCPR